MSLPSGVSHLLGMIVEAQARFWLLLPELHIESPIVEPEVGGSVDEVLSHLAAMVPASECIAPARNGEAVKI
jgi:hypothetical protein